MTDTFSALRINSVLAFGLYGSDPKTLRIQASRIIRCPAWASHVSKIPSRITSDYVVSSSASEIESDTEVVAAGGLY